MHGSSSVYSYEMRKGGRGSSPPKILSALRASVWSKNKGGPPLNAPLENVFFSCFLVFSSQSLFWVKDINNFFYLLLCMIIGINFPVVLKIHVSLRNCQGKQRLVHSDNWSLRGSNMHGSSSVYSYEMRKGGRGSSPPKILSALRASVWSKNKGGPPLNAPLENVFFSCFLVFSSQSLFWVKDINNFFYLLLCMIIGINFPVVLRIHVSLRNCRL